MNRFNKQDIELILSDYLGLEHNFVLEHLTILDNVCEIIDKYGNNDDIEYIMENDFNIYVGNNGKIVDKVGDLIVYLAHN